MGWLTDLMKEYPSVAVVKERLEFEEKRHEQTKAENAELHLRVDELAKEKASLKEENAALRQELAALKSLDEFEDKGGYLWKKGTRQGPYCPKCKGSMRHFGSGYICNRCA